MTPLLAARGLAAGHHHGRPVVSGVDLTVWPGESVALLGENGAGKTTLLWTLAGLLEPLEGTVLVAGRPPREARREIGILFQDPSDQLFNPTVYDEIAYAPRSLGLPEDEVRKLVLEAAEKLGLTGLLDVHPARLSTGLQKRVALASIIVYKPRLLLLDEPSANLDAGAYRALEEVLREHLRGGGAAVIATHSVDDVIRLSTRTCLVSRGRLQWCTPTREALASGRLAEAPLPLPAGLEALARLLGWRKAAEALEAYMLAAERSQEGGG